ncbi:hypothetical protein [Alkalibacillus silvisoli]
MRNELLSLIDKLQQDDYKTRLLRRLLMMAFSVLLREGNYDDFRKTMVMLTRSGFFRDVVKDEELVMLASLVGRRFR